MAKSKMPTFEDETRYRVSFAAPAEHRDTRFIPKHAYVLKGRVAKLVKASIAEASPVGAAE